MVAFKMIITKTKVPESKSYKKFIHSEKATKFCEVFTLLLTGTTQDKSKVEISQNFVAFSEYMNFTNKQSMTFTKQIGT